MRSAPWAAALVLASRSVVAQAPSASLRFDAASTSIRADAADSRSTGAWYGGEGMLVLSRLFLTAGYGEADLHPDRGPGGVTHLVEGGIEVGARPWPWFAVSAGPFARALTGDSGTQRQVLWWLKGRVEMPIIHERLSSYVELWQALAQRADPSGAGGSAHGGSAGLALHLTQLLALHLGYRIEEAPSGNGAGNQTVEAVTLGVQVSPQ